MFFNDGKGELTSKEDKIRKTAGPISMTIRIMENEIPAYFLYMYCRDKLKLKRSLCMKVIKAWDPHYRVDPERARFDKSTGRVKHEGLDTQDEYLTKDAMSFVSMGIDINNNSLFNLVRDKKKVNEEKEVAHMKLAEE